MKFFISFLLLISTTTLFAQEKDTRAELKTDKFFTTMSVSPDERVWLLNSSDEISYSDTINGFWHYSPMYSKDGKRYIAEPLKFYFFNKMQAIMLNAVGDKKEERKIYRTDDRGISWSFVSFGGNALIHCASVDSFGHAWMAGFVGPIYYSHDYGHNWEPLHNPCNSGEGLTTISMRSETTGVCGTFENSIYETNNNWQSAKNIPTPRDQGKLKHHRGQVDNHVREILLWDNYLVVDQGGHIFYSDTGNINWKKFPVAVKKFTINERLGKLIVVTANREVFTFSAPDKYDLFTDEKLNAEPLDIMMGNNSLYTIGQGCAISKITPSGIITSSLYTADRKIEEPPVIRSLGKLAWGASGNNLYIETTRDKEWYREHILDFEVTDIVPLNDAEAILFSSDGSKYRYSLIKHAIIVDEDFDPLKEFLEYPVKSVTIISRSNGCCSPLLHTIAYEGLRKGKLRTNKMKISCSNDSSVVFFNEISADSITSILSRIDTARSFNLSIKDFNVTNDDKADYIENINKLSKSHDQFEGVQITKDNKDFFMKVSEYIDTIGTVTLQAALDMHDYKSSQEKEGFTITIINTADDSIEINSHYSVYPACHLPWTIKPGWHVFKCYDLGVTKFFSSCLPDSFRQKDTNENVMLMLQVAKYLYACKQEED